ncbi:MAG: four helix bundle protein [Bacteroidota bacterium]|nr:four helix bundle protein [Bacteroidota bacterium]
MTRTRSLENDPSFVRQIRRASVSVMNTLAEGFGRKGPKEFVHFLYMAKAIISSILQIQP